MSKLFIFSLVACLFFSCSNDAKRPATALDTGREFIRATLDGNLEKAQSLLLSDSLNTRIFESYRDFYQRLSATQKKSYQNASYTINDYKDLNDSVTLINYSNDYMNKPMDIKVLRRDKVWSIDFAYTSGDTTITQ